MSKGFEIDDDYCRESAAVYFAEEEEMKLGIHPTKIKDRIKDWFHKNDDGNVDITRLDEWTDSTVKVYIRRTGMVDGKFFGIFNYINNEFDSIEDPVDVLITEHDEARISIDLWFSEHEIDKDFYIEETTPESNLVKVYIDDDDEYEEFSKLFGIFDTDKCDFVDDQMSISENMKFLGIEDNPFDIMIHAAIELTRSVMFAARRHRNKDIPESLWKSEKDVVDSYAEMIHHQYNILNSVNEETIKFLRKHSFMGTTDYNGGLSTINEYLFNIGEKIDISYTQNGVPCRDLEYEKVRLGEDSKEYQRLIFLIDLTDRLFLSIDYLSSMIDLINNGERVLEYGWVTMDNYNYMKSIINDNHLSCQDIEYMISYLEKKERK